MQIQRIGSMEVIYGKDGKRYPTVESAKAADQAYDAQLKAAGGGKRGGLGGYKASGGGQSDMANEFLKQWGNINDSVLNTLNETIDSIGSGGSYPGSGQMQALISRIGEQADLYDEKYGGLEQESIDAAKEATGQRRELASQYMDLADPDYEGVAGRASADVRSASEQAMGAQARQAMGYGVDPTSGKFGALTKKSYLDQARNEAIAMNLARRGEKERVSGMTERGLQLIDPGLSAGIAQDIAQTRKGMTTTQADLQLADTTAGMQAMRTKADLASRVADIGRDYGDVGLTMAGVKEGRDASTPGSSISSPVGGGQASSTPAGGGMSYGSTTPQAVNSSPPAVQKIRDDMQKRLDKIRGASSSVMNS